MIDNTFFHYPHLNFRAKIHTLILFSLSYLTMVLHADFVASRINQVVDHTIFKSWTVSFVFEKSGIDGRVAMFQVGNAVPIS